MSHQHGRAWKLAAAAIAGLGLAAGPLVALPAYASTDGTGVVINEVYLSGGSAGALYKNKFVELYNPSDTAVTVSGWSLQYRTATGAGLPSTVINLSGKIAPHDYYLIAGGSNGTNGADLPTPDVTSTLAPANGGGTLFLANTTNQVTAPVASVTNHPQIVDLLGWGTSNTFEGAVAPAPKSTTDVQSLTRANFVDSDDNHTDFSLTPNITPQASTPATTDPGDGGTDPGDGTDPGTGGDPSPPITIAEIQGTSNVSPLEGKTVTTTGFVTAAYPTGGFNGYFIQTPGTGGALDLATHTESDGLFVFSSATVSTVHIGDYVKVSGVVSEYNGMTQLTPTSAADVSQLDKTGVTAPTAATVVIPPTEEQRESLEGMLIAPQGAYTITDNYSLNQYGEIGLAVGDKPLVQPTEVAGPRTAEYDAALALNASLSIKLDDGASTNFLSAANQGKPLSWLTADDHVRVGSAVSFTGPAVMDYRNNAWKLQPTSELTPANAATVQPATFSNTRTEAPANVGGDVKVATFNVLNYFATTGDQVTGCTFYKDRDGNPVTVNTGCDVRGAANEASFKRQQAKEVVAINDLGADIVSLEEIENSSKFLGTDGKPKNRDYALSTLVDALNAAAGSAVWDYVRSPSALPSNEDVIRTAFIYKTAKVETVGSSEILLTGTAFDNARRPLAQAFKQKGAPDSQAFIDIVNHFKSKGSGTGVNADQGDGQGASNPSRVAQAKDLVKFADDLKASTGIGHVMLVGDFNAYMKEDPIKVLTDAGYVDQVTTKTDKYTYAYGGTVGSLDHIFANAEANADVTGADVWNINSVESVALEYSRYNYNVTNYYVPNQYRASDHDPIIVGLGLSPKPVTLNLLNINDFHGRIDSNTVKFAGTVEQLRAEGGDSNTLFLSAGDNIGASLFASASQQDKPTIDVLNALKLKASAVGNHEFDQGFSDLTGRVQSAADFAYLGANVYTKGTKTPALPEYKTFQVDGLTVAVIGVVTQETPTLVTPAGISGLDFGDPVEAVNRVAGQLTDGNPFNGEADVIVAEYHEGAGFGTPDGATLEQEVAAGGAFANIVTMTSPKVAAIFTGHTHKMYAWDAPVPGSDSKTRPILQTGSYGENIGQIQLTIDPTTHAVSSYTARNVSRTTTADGDLVASYPRVAEVKTIVDKAIADAAVIGNQKVGSVSKDITTAFIGGSRDDRMSESTLGNLVADSLLASLKSPDVGGAEIGIVNPGGLRADLLYGTDGSVTYAQANAVLPFLNNLGTTTLTGAQFKVALEQQWQTNADGTVPSRDFLNLGLSKNVSYTYDPTRERGDHITGITVNGEPIDLARDYRIGTFSFLLSGGDNFRVIAQGANTKDSGLVDRDAWIAYITGNSPLSPSFDRRGVSLIGVPTTAVAAGDTVSFDVTKLNLTSLGSPANTELSATWQGSASAPVAFAVNEVGAASVSLTVPADVTSTTELILTAAPSGTTVRVPLTVVGNPNAEPSSPAVSASAAAQTSQLADVFTVPNGAQKPGTTLTLKLGADKAGQWVSAWFWATPVKKSQGINAGGWLQVAADGSVTVTVPSGLENGRQSLAVQDATGAVIGWTELTVPAAGKVK
ncbi:ExeM/NucH family extracellular endonuclease [Rathayibacter soli]|uniref:ExeM/NucH family extracellular endonuclease n=1 Tax=Rathayibacter soli TaxID=3144168 RepID=UPI0027E5BCF7|nr:ExeM/NucH family extracellular endonuclease [Glaciibacter superstes]